MTENYGLFYKTIRRLLRMVTPRFSVSNGHQMSDAEAVVYVSHHQNLFGPVSVLVWYPEYVQTWILGVFLKFETCYAQYVDYTFTKRLGWPRWIARVAAYPLAWFASTLTTSGKGIPVYRQSREVMQTMKQTVATLENGESILIFPDVYYDDTSPEVKEIYEGFLYIEKYYYRKTGQHIPFVPMYSDRENKEIRVGAPILFSGTEKFFVEKQQVAGNIQMALNELAKVPEKVPVESA
ncbi:lysophospholipid acyltransferase family protein [Jeotgalibaca caeni]|uniref:lysophospholipid acyltransferase family protein n=1 Tax=Jeotgalibaca caeni TaxID=3028623 RepID=UPI00237EAA12|nr:hypothetical protein [Jeotgalibaca caeni]MDE1549445.1 hypothetical protein [Jeotgalibaca caeni]